MLVDARHGVVPQTRRHATLAHLVGMPHLVVAVNKMDLVDYRQERYARIVAEFRAFAARTGIDDVRFVPLSALTATWWWTAARISTGTTGPTLLEVLERRGGLAHRATRPSAFRCSTSRGPTATTDAAYLGRVEAGSHRRGRRVIVLPSGGRRIAHSRAPTRRHDCRARDCTPRSRSRSTTTLDVSRGDMHRASRRGAARRHTLSARRRCWFDERTARRAAHLPRAPHDARGARPRRPPRPPVDVSTQRQEPAPSVRDQRHRGRPADAAQPLVADRYWTTGRPAASSSSTRPPTTRSPRDDRARGDGHGLPRRRRPRRAGPHHAARGAPARGGRHRLPRRAGAPGDGGARPHAEKIAVGKRCGKRSTAQRFINKRLVDAARKHDVVVRLKGGDPMLFGRAQEEIGALKPAGVRFEVVPGVTAALAAAANCGSRSRGAALHARVTVATPRVGDIKARERLGAGLIAPTPAIYISAAEQQTITATLFAAGGPQHCGGHGGMPRRCPAQRIRCTTLQHCGARRCARHNNSASSCSGRRFFERGARMRRFRRREQHGAATPCAARGSIQFLHGFCSQLHEAAFCGFSYVLVWPIPQQHRTFDTTR